MIIIKNDSSRDEVIDLVIRPKTAKNTRHDDETTEQGRSTSRYAEGMEVKQVLRGVPLKQVLQRQENIDTELYYKPESKPRTQNGNGDEDKR